MGVHRNHMKPLHRRAELPLRNDNLRRVPRCNRRLKALLAVVGVQFLLHPAAKAEEGSILASNLQLFEAELKARREVSPFGVAQVHEGILRTKLYRRPKLEWALPGEIELLGVKSAAKRCTILSGFLNETAAAPYMLSMTDFQRVPEGKVQVALIRFQGRMKKVGAPSNGFISNDGKVRGKTRQYVLIDRVIASQPMLMPSAAIKPECA
jgi:hypothetical protein